MATLTTIAKEAGFSVSTTAKILRPDDESPFAESTRSKVLETAKRLNYRPNVAARTMKSRRTNCMALLIRHGNRPWLPTNPSGLGYLLGVQEALAERNIHLILVSVEEFDGKREVKMPLVFRENLVDGMIVAYGVPAEMEKVILASEEPMVWLDTPRQMTEDCVFPDEHHNVCVAVRHLVARGHERIIYVGNTESVTHYSSQVRYQAYLGAMAEAGLKPDVWQIHNKLDSKEIGELYMSYMRDVDPGTVLLAYDTNDAQQLSQAAAMLGVKVPEHAGIFTLDKSKMLLGRWQFFAGVFFDRKEMGRRAAQMLLEKVENGNQPVPSVGFKGGVEGGDSCR